MDGVFKVEKYSGKIKVEFGKDWQCWKGASQAGDIARTKPLRWEHV